MPHTGAAVAEEMRVAGSPTKIMNMEEFVVLVFLLDQITVAHGNVRLSHGNCLEHRKAPDTNILFSVY